MLALEPSRPRLIALLDQGTCQAKSVICPRLGDKGKGAAAGLLVEGRVILKILG